MGEESAAGVPWGEGLGQGDWAGWGGEIANEMAHTQKGETSLCCTHVAPERTEATQSNLAWQERAGAMGGGTEASLRCRRMRVITDSWVMAAMIRSAPRRQKGSRKAPSAHTVRKTRGHSQSKHTPQEPRPAPGRGASLRRRLIHTLLAWRRDDRPAQLTVRGETARGAHEMDARQGHERSQLLQEFQWRQLDTGRTVRPWLGKGINEIAIGIFCKTLQRHGASRCVPNQAFQLVTPVRRDMRVGVQRKPAQTGTARSREFGELTFIPKA